MEKTTLTFSILYSPEDVIDLKERTLLHSHGHVCFFEQNKKQMKLSHRKLFDKIVVAKQRRREELDEKEGVTKRAGC